MTGNCWKILERPAVNDFVKCLKKRGLRKQVSGIFRKKHVNFWNFKKGFSKLIQNYKKYALGICSRKPLYIKENLFWVR